MFHVCRRKREFLMQLANYKVMVFAEWSIYTVIIYIYNSYNSGRLIRSRSDESLSTLSTGYATMSM